MKKVLNIYLLWNILIVILILFSLKILPLQMNFLGGSTGNYLSSPLIWSHANYDGDHYIEIARHGYGPYEYFYFPLFPILLKIPSQVFGDSFLQFVLSGTAISIFSTGVALWYLCKLVALDKSIKNIKLLLLCLLLFPTSFYFQFVYTEGLFLALAICSLFFARKGQFWLASVLVLLASATRVIGVGLCVALFIEWYLQKRPKLDLIPVILSSTGLISYLYYLLKSTGDPLVIIHKVAIFGDQRSQHLILLPQVFYRYIFKILPSLTNYWPVTFITIVEFLAGLFFMILLIISFRKIRFSYWVYMFIGYIIPSLSGSFSSMPRYILVLFPMFMFITAYLEKIKIKYRIGYFVASFILLCIMTMMFVRGYWVS